MPLLPTRRVSDTISLPAPGVSLPAAAAAADDDDDDTDDDDATSGACCCLLLSACSACCGCVGAAAASAAAASAAVDEGVGSTAAVLTAAVTMGARMWSSPPL